MKPRTSIFQCLTARAGLWLGIVSLIGCSGNSAPQTSASAPAAEVPVPMAPAASLEATGDATAEASPFRALLVGCTTYDHLGPQSALRGCANDVKMMRQVLKDRFGFKSRQIRSLIEGGADTERPTKANIVRELDQLAADSKAGDRVVILLSGHGSQQPNNDPGNPDDPEPDGLDELFCPADISSSDDDTSPYAKNALTDDELRLALGKIRQKGAFVWIIVDACHSGSGVRGTEVYRQLAPEVLIGKAALQKARQSVPAATRGLARDDQLGGVVDAAEGKRQGGMVAIYAAQPHEPTLETVLPRDGDDPEWRGLLSYTLLKILVNAETPLTYRELVQRIHSEYIQSYGRLRPTPLIEGLDQNLEILGQTEVPPQSEFVLTREPGGPLSINAGRLQGCSKGTVFAVFPPSGERKSAQPLGYVKSQRALLSSCIVDPVEYQTVPENAQLPHGGRCEAVEVQYGNLTLNVTCEDQSSGKTDDQQTSIPELLNSIAAEPGQRVQVTTESAQADWIVRRNAEGAVHLVPAEGWSKVSDDTHFGPAPEEGRLDWLRERLGRIARVKSLLKLSAASTQQKPGGLMRLLGSKLPCEIRLELMSVAADSDEAQPIKWGERKQQLIDGEQVVLQVQNSGSESIDFTVLFIDSKYGITPLFPPPGVVGDNRIAPGQKYLVGPMQVEASTLGLEHLFVIATKAEGQPQSFGWLEQESLEAVQAATRGAGQKHPLGELFSQVLYSRQNVRGMKMADAEATCLRAISWQTVKQSDSPIDPGAK